MLEGAWDALRREQARFDPAGQMIVSSLDAGQAVAPCAGAGLSSRRVANAMNDHDLSGDAIEDQVGIRIGDSAAHIALPGRLAAVGMIAEPVDRRLQADADVLRALPANARRYRRGSLSFGGRRVWCSGPSKPVFRPHGANVLVRGKLAARLLGERGFELGLVFG